MKASIKYSPQTAFIWFLTFALGGLMVFSSCAPLYLPNSIYVPMVEEQGDINATANVGVNGFNLQAGVAFTDNMLVMGSLAGNNNGKSGEDAMRHSFWEFGLGYYTEIEQNFRFNILAGYGRGSTLAWTEITGITSLSPDPITIRAQGDYSRYFLQPAIRFTKDDYELSLISRFSFVDFPTIAYGRDFQNNTVGNAVFMEPVVNISVEWKNVKFYGQTGFSLKLGYKDDFDHLPVIFASGALINLKLKKNK